jgi:hypothetical protein
MFKLSMPPENRQVRRYLIGAAAARIKTMIASSQTNPIARIIPGIIPSIIMAHLTWVLGRSLFPIGFASNPSRAANLTQLNIVNAHGNTARIRNNPAAASQLQFRTTPKTTAAAESR